MKKQEKMPTGDKEDMGTFQQMIPMKYVQKALKPVKIKCKILEISLDYGKNGSYNISVVLTGMPMRIRAVHKMRLQFLRAFTLHHGRTR